MPLKYRTRRVSKHKRKTVKRGGHNDEQVPSGPSGPSAQPNTSPSMFSSLSSLSSWFSSSKQPADTPVKANPVGGNKRSKKYKSRKSRKSTK